MKLFKQLKIMLAMVITMSLLSFGNVYADSTAGADSKSEVKQTFEAAEKAFPNQGGVNYSQMLGYFGDNNKPGHQFIELDKLMMYNNSWNIKSKYPEGVLGLNLQITPHAKQVAEADESKVITCVNRKFDQTKVKVKLLAIGAINSTNKNLLSSDLLDRILYEASTYGATHIQFLNEGTNTELSASSWGVGFAYTKAGESSIGSGGTGWTTGWSGYDNLPWQQFMFLKVSDPNAVADVEVKKEVSKVVTSKKVVDTQVDKAVKAQTGNHKD